MEKVDRLWQDLGELVNSTVESAVAKVSAVPGSAFVVRYIKSSYQNDPIRTLLELLLLLFAIRYFLASKYSTTKKNYVHLEDYEVDELVDDWEPEPLVSPLTDLEKRTLANMPIIKGPNGPRVHLTSEKEVLSIPNKLDAALLTTTIVDYSQASQELVNPNQYLNFTMTDVFGFGVRPDVRAEAVKTIHEYGVGSCGPAGFYGNQDAHVECESTLAKFLGTEAAILYSQGFATPSSVIPCFFKRGDYIVADKNVNISIQKGILLSRANVLWYEHNDMVDLEAKVAQAIKMHRSRSLPRRIIITEGIFEYSGDSPDLAKMVEIRNKYKFRLMVDESWSFGVLGKTGRGLAEACGVDRRDVDFTIASLANAGGSAGGFCAGWKFMVDHQQITSLAYTFSATMPPYLARNTSAIVREYLSDPAHETLALSSLREKVNVFVNTLEQDSEFNKYAYIVSRRESPLVVVRLHRAYLPQINKALIKVKQAKVAEEELADIYQRIVEATLARGVIISRQQVLGRFEKFDIVQGLRVVVNDNLTSEEIESGAKAFASAISEVFA
ncbi:uncharacterized protein SAPINGB_P003185 [Magnusiomyces paraingens]|uniref:serine C-palmitoyltransferase n=1 Tax=Magnusiomyces paraingens TaxID=2606893 RepID=A0A5E8BJ70_9ASCO|nr:uncharacterized protein SAPINGB_P003185 [Saprochaete ingens]VVT51704.1 unnamed protein product [Saprochaete ingens]